MSASAAMAGHAAQWRDSFFDAMPVAIVIIDAAGSIADVNQGAEQFFNRARSALVGRLIDDLILWPGGDSFARQRAQPGKAMWAYSIALRLGGGGEALADLSLGPEQGERGWRALAIHPVPRGGRTPFRKPGSAARSAGAAAAMLAHEIKNPLSGIRGAAQLMGRNPAGSDVPSLSRLIVGEVDRIAQLIDSMQGFTRDAPLACSAINIYPAIDQARDIARQGFAASVRFVEEFDPSLPLVSGNHDALVQILLNLVKNAAEALGEAPRGEQAVGQEGEPAGGEIRLMTAFRHGLSWDADDGRGQRPLPVEITVADNGPGVPDALVDSLFDPFVTGKSEGQGLGLALVDKLTREMGGLVQHERVGGWTRFRLHLPVAAPDRFGSGG